MGTGSVFHGQGLALASAGSGAAVAGRFFSRGGQIWERFEPLVSISQNIVAASDYTELRRLTEGRIRYLNSRYLRCYKDARSGGPRA